MKSRWLIENFSLLSGVFLWIVFLVRNWVKLSKSSLAQKKISPLCPILPHFNNLCDYFLTMEISSTLKTLANYYIYSGFSVWITGLVKLIQNYVIAFQIKSVWLQPNSNSWLTKVLGFSLGSLHCQAWIGPLFLKQVLCNVFLALASE